MYCPACDNDTFINLSGLGNSVVLRCKDCHTTVTTDYNAIKGTELDPQCDDLIPVD